MTYRDALATAVARADRLAVENALLTARLSKSRRFDFVAAVLVALICLCVVALGYLFAATG